MSATKSEGQRRRRREQAKARKHPWWRTYRKRIADGLEVCHRCGKAHWPDVNPLVFAHINPNLADGAFTLDNITLLCQSCDRWFGERTITTIPSLEAEEKAGPPERRWGLNAEAAVPKGTCPVCGRENLPIGTDPAGLWGHWIRVADGDDYRCPGSDGPPVDEPERS